MKSNSLPVGVAATLIIIVSLVFLPVLPVVGETLGPNNPGTAVNNTDVGTVPWTNPGNITSPGSPYATADFSNTPNLVSNYLLASNYGFSIPSDATITGITVAVNRYVNNTPSLITDQAIYLVLNSAYLGDNKADTATSWPNSLVTASYGGPTDLWGYAWTPSQINDAGFGVALSVTKGSNGNRSAYVDSIQITVHYGYDTTTDVVCGNGTPETIYGSSISCVATVTMVTGTGTPSGTVSWTTDGSGSFATSPCTLTGSGGVSTCNVSYTPSAVGTGSHLISATYSGDNYFISSSASETVTVTQRLVSVSADAQTKVYGDADPALTYQITSGSLVAGDVFTGTLTRAPGENLGIYPIQQGSLALSADYDLTYIGADLTITQRPVTVTADAQSKIYGDPDPALTYQITSGSLLTGDVFSGTLTRAPGEDIGLYPIQQGTLALSANYDLSYVGADLTITQRPIAVSADAQTKAYGDPDPVLTYQVTSGSLLPGDVFTGALTRAPGEDLGTYPIRRGTLALPNYYDLSFTGADLTINQRLITVQADAQMKAYGDPDPALTYQITSGSLLAGDDFTGTLTRLPGEDLGTYPIQQGSLALAAYYDLTYNGADLTIVVATPILSVTNSPVDYTGFPQAAIVVGSVDGVVSNILYDGSAVAPTNVGTYAVTADFTPTDTVHYNSLTAASAGNFVISPVYELTLVVVPVSDAFGIVDAVINYSYQLTNTGLVELTGPFTVTDDKANVNCPVIATLASGESIYCDSMYTITSADMIAGYVTNTATGSGFFAGTQVTSNVAQATVTAHRLFLPVIYN